MMWRRRRSIVNFREQLWFSLELVVVSIGFVILCAFFLYLPDPQNSQRFFDQAIRFVLLRWHLVMLALIVLTMIGLLLSHRLWGPLYGLKRVLETWQKGDRTARVRFRKYDFLLPAKESLNSFFENQEGILNDIQRLADEIQIEIKSGNSSAVEANAKEILNLLAKRDEE